jgi:hypothetical protein
MHLRILTVTTIFVLKYEVDFYEQQLFRALLATAMRPPGAYYSVS